MKIYALRDRLLDYFLVPFVAPSDNDVKAALAQRINTTRGDIEDALIQAPHHFELWQLGGVEEDGNIVPKLDFLADCSSLIRRGVRTHAERLAAASPVEESTGQSRRSESGLRSEAATPDPTVSTKAPAGPLPAPEARRKPEGSH